MQKKGECIRLIFELCFIFVIPLLLLCISINTTKSYTYDVDGNVVEEVRVFEFDEFNFISSNNPIIQVEELFEDSVHIDKTNNIVKFINYYNALWVLMFLIWHFIYTVFDGIVHILKRIGGK